MHYMQETSIRESIFKNCTMLKKIAKLQHYIIQKKHERDAKVMKKMMLKF